MTAPPPDRPAGGGVLDVVFVRVPRALTAALILAGIGVNFANVIARYAFGFAIFWAEEIMVFIVVWCVFVGAITVTYNGAHLRMDLVSELLPDRWKRLLNGLIAAAFIACCAFVVPLSFETVSFLRAANQVSVTASVPKEIPHAAILVGFAFMVLAVVARLRAYLSGRF